MAQEIRAKIGFVTPISILTPHFGSFRPLIPADVELEFEGLNLMRATIYDLKGTGEVVLERTAKAVKDRGWNGAIVSGAPVELLNPGLLDNLRKAVNIPITTALDSCVAALRSYSASRVLLLTPFDEPMNKLIREYLAGRGVEAVSPSENFQHYTHAQKLSPKEVYNYTKRSFEAVGNVQALYFQGAVLDPLKIIERIESDLGLPAVASNPAMLWFILSKLGLSYSIEGYGKLLREWNRLP
jgi:maleate cis-trans isomerase